MLEALIHLLVLVLVALVVWWLAKMLAVHFGAPPIVIQVVGAIIALVLLVYTLKIFRLGVP